MEISVTALTTRRRSCKACTIKLLIRSFLLSRLITRTTGAELWRRIACNVNCMLGQSDSGWDVFGRSTIAFSSRFTIYNDDRPSARMTEHFNTVHNTGNCWDASKLDILGARSCSKLVKNKVSIGSNSSHFRHNSTCRFAVTKASNRYANVEAHCSFHGGCNFERIQRSSNGTLSASITAVYNGQ